MSGSALQRDDAISAVSKTQANTLTNCVVIFLIIRKRVRNLRNKHRHVAGLALTFGENISSTNTHSTAAHYS